MLINTSSTSDSTTIIDTSQFEKTGESAVHQWLPGGHHVQLEIDQIIHERQFDGMDFSRPFDQTNAVLRVEDEDFHVHTFLLSLVSRYFRILFNGPFSESSDLTTPIELKEVSSCSFRNLLNCIYAYPNGFRITRGNISELLELSHYYDCERVTVLCENNLLYNLCHNIRSTQKMEWAIQYDLNNLKNQLLRQEPHLVELLALN
uniref:BTB domain-containing protein n=1 Tax=Caenorhabditis tropicalis TaxID=1561998 RepID=A0A1I7TJF2_9PELO